MAERLDLNSQHEAAALANFKLAVEQRFVQGRSAKMVVAACLYVVCRQEQTPHLLLDFSELLAANVYQLGACFMKLCRKLHITNLPLVDPSLYIDRFAHKLELGDKTHDVGILALSLVGRMKRDWLQVGRRPAGLCGAGA